MPRDPNKCDEEIHRSGIVHEVRGDLTKQQAEDLCERLTKETGLIHDWHYFGGRVVIKRLPGKFSEYESNWS